MRYRPLALCLAFAATPALAAPPQTPLAIVKAIYARLEGPHGDSYDPPDNYSARLRRLAAASRKAAGTDVPCGLDFSIWVNGQEQQITEAQVTRLPDPGPGRQLIAATFRNWGNPESLRFTYKLEGGRWRLDEAQSMSKAGWVFSDLLQCKGD